MSTNYGYGYWIKGNKIIDIYNSKHITYLIENPDDFNLTTEEIEAVYKKHNERMGSEGDAREELIKMVSNYGWIRVRHYTSRSNDYWSIQFDRYTLTNKKAIKNFIEWAVFDKKIMSINETITLTGFEDNYYASYGFTEGGVKKFLSENKKIKIFEITEELY